MEEVQRLLQAIHGKRVLVSQDDMILLKVARDECFSVKLLYKVMDWSDAVALTRQFIWNTWVPTTHSPVYLDWVPTKVSFFA